MQWFRLYNEFADDPKVQRLTEAMQRRLIMLFCFQSKGILNSLSDDQISFAMRISRNEWKKTKKNLEELKFIDASNNILNWDKRQRKSDNINERVKRHRINKLNNECNVTETLQHSYINNTRNVTETLLKRNCNVLEAEADTDTDKITKVDRSEAALEISTRSEFIALLEPKFPSMMFQGYVNQKVFQMLDFWEKEKVIPEDLKQAMDYVAVSNIDVSSPAYYTNKVIDYARTRIKNGNYKEMKKSNQEYLGYESMQAYLLDNYDFDEEGNCIGKKQCA